MSTLESVSRIIRAAAGLAHDEPITAETALVGSGLCLDSVAVLETLVAIENEYRIEINHSELSRAKALRTVGSLASLVDSIIAGDP